MTKQIPLTQNKVAIVDSDIFVPFMQWTWCAQFSKFRWYAIRKEQGKTILMHRAIMNVTDPKTEVDHRNGNGLDNRRDNLRVCTHAENQHNRGKQKNNTSGYKGVAWHKREKKYRAQIVVNGKYIELGYFSTAEDAARAYDETAKEKHGPFANLNFPQEQS